MSVPGVVVITGASAGVGRATARAPARRGARIGLIARGHEGLAATRDEVEAFRVTEVTYLGTVHGTLAALRRMRPRDAGTIVQVA